MDGIINREINGKVGGERTETRCNALDEWTIEYKKWVKIRVKKKKKLWGDGVNCTGSQSGGEQGKKRVH